VKTRIQSTFHGGEKDVVERPITSFHRSAESMLKHIKNKSYLKEDLLPSAKEVKAFYESPGDQCL